MRKAIFLLVALLLLASCSGDNMTGSVVQDINNTITNETPDFTVPELFSPENSTKITEQDMSEASPKELLAKFEKQQMEVYSERSKVLNRMRTIRQKIYDETVSFEDKQFYQKAYDILNQKKAELTLEATLLESDIKRMKKKVEVERDLKDARERLGELEDEKKQFVSDLRELGEEMDSARDSWLDALEEGNSSDADEKLDSLENDYAETSKELKDVLDEIKQKNELISGLEDFELSDERKDLIIKRQGIVEELGVVRNSLVEKYIELKDAASGAKPDVEEAISELESKERQLRDRLRNVSDKLSD